MILLNKYFDRSGYLKSMCVDENEGQVDCNLFSAIVLQALATQQILLAILTWSIPFGVAVLPHD